MIPLCVTAVAAALAGLSLVGVALGSASGIAVALLAAPVFGVVSLVTGVAAAVVAMRRDAEI